MSRYIDADALHKAYMELRNFKQDPQSGDWISLRAVPLTTVIRMLNDAPSIELEPKRGEWIKVDDVSISCRCSVCGWEAHLYEDDVYGMPYCPNCGADMRERKESE